MTNKRHIDIQMVSIDSDVATSPITFDSVIIELSGVKKNFIKKSHELKIWNRGDNSDYVSGIVITEQIKDLPPKRNVETGVFSSLGLQLNERLAYGNAFVYDKRLKVIFYEVNGKGCYLDTLADIMKDEWNGRQQGQQNQIVDINFVSIPRNGGFQAYQAMYYLKEFTFEVACPHEIIQAYANSKKSLLSAISRDLNTAVSNNADVMQIRYATLGKKTNKQGLDAGRIKKLVKAGQFLLSGAQRSNVTTLKVIGFETDPEGKSHRSTADLIADLLKGTIELPSVDQQSDLQEESRQAQIESLRSSLLETLRIILQTDNNG